MDEVTWGALTLTLTVVGVLWTWWAAKNRGAAAATRGAAFTLLPAAAWLTGTLEMFTEIAGSVADWATHLVLSPVVWSGIGLAGLSALLFLVSGFLRGRELARGPRAPRGDGDAALGAGGRGGQLPPASPPRGRPGRGAAQAGPVDDDLADIEALLRKRGIT
ncbi:cellulose synthase [Nocardioides solisilvae]|uniref:cellulose synthase n=1 Tax=Nocardioides solisilvae TaxID=1542435 RepID=UPI000D74ECC8|nr:cellulose synthase [Nocardioides solisilvae]